MTDFIRGKTQHKVISEKLEDQEIVSTKRITPKRVKNEDKDKKVNKKQKTSNQLAPIINEEGDGLADSDDDNDNNDENKVSLEEEKDRNLFASAYNSLKGKKKAKLVSKIDKLTPSQLKEYMNEPTTQLNKKEEADARKLLPFLKKNIPKSACRLLKKDLHTGMVVLATFEQVTEMDITISLPFGLKGYVKFNEISDSFTEWMKETLKREDENEKSTNFRKMKIISDQVRKMFYKGQMLKCAIVGLTDHHTIEGLHCTLRPELVNVGSSIDTFAEDMTIHGCIESIQDKGYIVSFGSKEYNGFLEFANTCYYYPDQTSDDQNQLYIGQPIESLIQSIDKSTKTFKLTISHPLVSRSTVKNSEVITMESIKAGMLVETKVLRVLSNGLHLGFLDFFAGDIFILHSQNPIESYKENQGVKARILFVDQVHKRIGLSTLNHVLGFKPYPFGTTKPGQYVESGKLTIERIEPLEMIVSTESTVVQSNPMKAPLLLKGYIHIEELESGVNDLTKASNQFKKTEALEKRCRVKHLDHLDGMVTYTARTRELEKKFYSYNDLSCGMIVQGVIRYVRADSLEVELATSIHGVVARHHMADTNITDPLEFFKVGATVKVRIINVEPEKKRLQLTLKKSLIYSEYPIITDKNTTPIGTISHGIITKTTRFLVFVSFYNNSFGVVEAQNLSNSKIESVQKQFPIGRTVLAKTLFSESSKSQPGLPLTLVIDDDDFNSQSQPNSNKKSNNNNKNNNKKVENKKVENKKEVEEEKVEKEKIEEEKVEEEKEQKEFKKVEQVKEKKSNTNNKKIIETKSKKVNKK
ncbi:hypothetical protein ACTFIU_003314 [Dictyostelium citrinum]